MTEQDTHKKQIESIRQLYRKQMVTFGVVILLAGVVIGVGGAMVYYEAEKPPRPTGIEHLRRRNFPNLKEELQLTEAQDKEIKEIFQAHMKNLQEIRMEGRKRIGTEMNSLNKKVLEVLTDEQDAKWTENINRLRDRFDPKNRQRKKRNQRNDGSLTEEQRKQRRMQRMQDDGRGGGPGGPFDFWKQPGEKPQGEEGGKGFGDDGIQRDMPDDDGSVPEEMPVPDSQEGVE